MTIATTARPITHRPAHGIHDFWSVRNLLIETYAITPLGFNWEVRRWDGRRFYDPEPDASWATFEHCVHLWETAHGRLVAVATPEGHGDAHLQVHPDYRDLEADMVDWAEEHLAAPIQNGNGRQIEIFVYGYDTTRQQLLAHLGYTKTDSCGVARRMRLAGPLLARQAMADGYTLRTTRPDDLADCQRIADLLNAAFGRSFHNAMEYQMFTRLAPSFRPHLDLVAVAPDGSFAAYVGVPYDEANRHGIFEPVCTHPDHQRRGLARALMVEGLHRLQSLGAVDVTVETGDMIPANRLYDGLGFTETATGAIWRKEV